MWEDKIRTADAHAVSEMADISFTRSNARHENESGCVVAVRGDLDIATSGMLSHELDDVLSFEDGEVTIDLSGVAFIDSSALSVLVRAHERAREEGRNLVIALPSPACAKVLSLTGLDRLFDVR